MKILFITLSNLGDVILSLPVLDALKERYLQAKITVMVGPRPKEVFANASGYIDRLIIYDKHSGLSQKVELFNELKKENFDIVIDLRNSLFGALLPAKYRTSAFLGIPRHIHHLKERNLYRLQDALRSEGPVVAKKSKLPIDSPQDKIYIERLLAGNGLGGEDKLVAISVGAASSTKLWDTENFLKLCDELCHKYKLILIGSSNHKARGEYISQNCRGKVWDFIGLTTMGQMVSLLKRADAVVTCDTGILHMASYLNRPLVVIFGPGNEAKYGPWPGAGIRKAVVTREVACRPCEKAQCRFQDVDCVRLVRPQDAALAVEYVLGEKELKAATTSGFKRILVARTDRIGDVVLTTPVLKAVRDNCPNSYIAVMVSPSAREIVEGNPYIDEVIVYSKDKAHRGIKGFWGFVGRLKRRKFDLAIILHTKKRINLITYLADIPRRIGYQDKNFGFLLSDKIEDTRPLGLKHEVDYCLDVLRNIGLEAKDRGLYVPLKKEALEWADKILQENDIVPGDNIALIHPGASCVSKRWMKEKFVVLANRLVEDYSLKLVITASGIEDIACAAAIAKEVRYPALNLAGKTSVAQLAALLKRAAIFISNDSGPVHIASAIGTPVVSIFGRNQAGLSPARWGPIGARDKYLHKEVGCAVCLAHNCKIGFDCLKAITVEDVLKAVDDILK